jgi:hypothetical protein
MKRIAQILLVIFMASLLTSCELIKNAHSYKHKTKALVEDLLKEDYDAAITHFATEHEMAKDVDVDRMKAGLADFRSGVVDNFGTDLEYSFMKAEKNFSTEEEKNPPPNTTIALIEFSNGKEFGVFKILFDDVSGKILNIATLDVQAPVPSMTGFWLFGILALAVPVFNIYVIRQIRKSAVKKKWAKYIAVIFLNVPAITYAVMEGLSVKLLSFQILLGISFSYMGFQGSYWTFGIPLGGLYWFWRLRQGNPNVVEPDVLADPELDIKPMTE